MKIHHQATRSSTWNDEKTWLVGFGGAILAIVLQCYHPFALVNLPKSEWVIVTWVTFAYVIANSFLMALCLRFVTMHKENQARFIIRLGLYLAFSYILGVGLYVALRTFIEWKKSPIGLYLLPPHSTYFFIFVWRYLSPLLWGLVAALGMSGILVMVSKITKGRAVSFLDVSIFFWIGLVLGWERLLIAFVLAIITAISWSVIRRGKPVQLAPFLLTSAFFSIFFGRIGTALIFGLQ